VAEVGRANGACGAKPATALLSAKKGDQWVARREKARPTPAQLNPLLAAAEAEVVRGVGSPCSNPLLLAARCARDSSF
jgi:hypothetical protein